MSSKLALLLKGKRQAPPAVDNDTSTKPRKRSKQLQADNQQQEQQQSDFRQHSHTRNQQQQQQHLKHQQQGRGRRGATTANFGAAAAAADASNDSDHDFEVPADKAYDTLLSLLSKQGGGRGAALQQQKAQQQGISDASGSESGGEDLSESEDGIDQEEDHHHQQQQQQQKHKQQEAKNTGKDSKADAGEQDAAAAAADADAAGSPEQQQQQEQDGEEDAPALAAAAAAAVGSTWEQYMSAELSDQQVSVLRGGGPVQWQAAGEGQEDPTDGLWKRAKWQYSGRPGFPPAPAQLSAYGVKERLASRWQEVHKEDADRLASNAAASTSSSSSSSSTLKDGDFASPQQRTLFSLFDSYADVFYAAKPYPGDPGWRPGQPDEAMDAVLLHVLNHCAKTADVVKKNNDRIKGLDAGSVSDVPRDQGFTRPKVLLLLPMRNMAYQVVKRLVALAQRETRADSVQGKEKFVEQFVGDDDDDETLAQQEAAEATAAAGHKTKAALKPAEHRALFSGNLDDHFRLGIRITRGQIKLFADPMQSDIIVASPVGLATKLAEDAAAAAEADEGRGGGKKGGGGGKGPAAGSSSSSSGAADFLSSIEVCVMERADVMLMQNWQHVVTVLEALNQLPKQQHGVNIMRVKLHLLASQGSLYRQTIMTSSFANPQLNATFNRHTSSHAGKFRLVATPSGVLGQVVPQVRQLFERFSCVSAAAAPDARFEFFKMQLWPRLAEGAAGGGLLLVVPSYFDFVRIRNFVKAEDADYTVLSEYSSFPQVTRARALFFQRRRRLMLYTERAHFYHRYRIRGIQDIVFYGLPDHAHFYAELINLIQTSGSAAAGHHATITTLFCQFDALALARVVGHSRASKMLTPSSSPTFVFC